jgi:hypothetical protein
MLICLVLLATSLTSCRSVRPVKELHFSSAPHIASLTLLNGQSVTFDQDFGWFDQEKGIIEGLNDSGKAVSVTLMQVNTVETVREYALVPAILTLCMILAGAVYVLYKLLSIF